MIEIRYKKILFGQTFFLTGFSFFLYLYFNKNIDFHSHPRILSFYFLFWSIFIISNLIFINFFALPRRKLLEELTSTTNTHDLSWLSVEESLMKKNRLQQIIQSEYEIENTKYKTLLDSLHDPVCIFKKDQVILYSNSSFDLLFSLNKDEPRRQILEITRNFYFHDFVSKAIVSNKIEQIGDFSFSFDTNSQKKYFEITIIPLNEIQTYLCVLHDITEKKFADVMREDFISNFSHEIRTPLAILNGQLQMLKIKLTEAKIMDHDYNQFFYSIDKNISRMTNLFKDLLQLTSIEKKQNLNKELVQIGPLISELFEEISRNYKQKKITYSLEFDENNFNVDYHLFEQVAINLIENAYKYTDDEGLISVSTFSDDEHNYFKISNTGIGIPEDQLHRVFERFFRADLSRSDEIEGTGLGLSIVKHIVLKHDGKIKITSVQNELTTFTIMLPRLAD